MKKGNIIIEAESEDEIYMTNSKEDMKEEESCLHKTTEAVFIEQRQLIPESEEKEKPSPRKGFVAYEPEYENIKI